MFILAVYKKDYEKIIFISNLNYANIISIISLINLNNIKVILTERSSISELKYSYNLNHKLKNNLIYFFAKILYKFSDLVVTNSKFEKNYLQDKFQLILNYIILLLLQENQLKMIK